MTSIIKCEHCQKELYDHAGCYRQALNYEQLLEFVKSLETTTNSIPIRMRARNLLKEIGGGMK